MGAVMPAMGLKDSRMMLNLAVVPRGVPQN